MASAHLVIPGEPIAKGRPRATVRGGKVRTFTPERTREAEAYVIRLAAERWAGPPLSGPVRLRVEAFFPIRASWSKARQASEVGQPHLIKPDADNLLKLYADALNGIAYEDDAQIFDGRCLKWWAPMPRVEIHLTEVRL
jgi:Holliday junction resolvase RusA-like endonuclease